MSAEKQATELKREKERVIDLQSEVTFLQKRVQTLEADVETARNEFALTTPGRAAIKTYQSDTDVAARTTTTRPGAAVGYYRSLRAAETVEEVQELQKTIRRLQDELKRRQQPRCTTTAGFTTSTQTTETTTTMSMAPSFPAPLGVTADIPPPSSSAAAWLKTSQGSVAGEDDDTVQCVSCGSLAAEAESWRQRCDVIESAILCEKETASKLELVNLQLADKLRRFEVDRVLPLQHKLDEETRMTDAMLRSCKRRIHEAIRGFRGRQARRGGVRCCTSTVTCEMLPLPTRSTGIQAIVFDTVSRAVTHTTDNRPRSHSSSCIDRPRQILLPRAQPGRQEDSLHRRSRLWSLSPTRNSRAPGSLVAMARPRSMQEPVTVAKPIITIPRRPTGSPVHRQCRQLGATAESRIALPRTQDLPRTQTPSPRLRRPKALNNTASYLFPARPVPGTSCTLSTTSPPPSSSYLYPPRGRRPPLDSHHLELSSAAPGTVFPRSADDSNDFDGSSGPYTGSTAPLSLRRSTRFTSADPRSTPWAREAVDSPRAETVTPAPQRRRPRAGPLTEALAALQADPLDFLNEQVPSTSRSTSRLGWATSRFAPAFPWHHRP